MAQFAWQMRGKVPGPSMIESERFAALSAAAEFDGQWVVVRHGGRSSDRWRVVHRTFAQPRANRSYRRVYERMRQGGAALIDPDGKIVNWYSAPLARRRLA